MSFPQNTAKAKAPKKVFQCENILGGMGYMGQSRAAAGRYERWRLLKIAKKEGYTHAIVGGKTPTPIDTMIDQSWRMGGQEHAQKLRDDARWVIIGAKLRQRRGVYFEWLDRKIRSMTWETDEFTFMAQITAYSNEMSPMSIRGLKHGPLFMSYSNSPRGQNDAVIHRQSGTCLGRVGNRIEAKRLICVLLDYWPQWDYKSPKDVPATLKTIATRLTKEITDDVVPWGWLPPLTENGPCRFDPEQEKIDKYLNHGMNGHRVGYHYASQIASSEKYKIPPHRRK